jgi:hypothetical protein
MQPALFQNEAKLSADMNNSWQLTPASIENESNSRAAMIWAALATNQVAKMGTTFRFTWAGFLYVRGPVFHLWAHQKQPHNGGLVSQYRLSLSSVAIRSHQYLVFK